MLENSGPYRGRAKVSTQLSASINMNANTTPVNMTMPSLSAPMNPNPVHISSHINNAHLQFVHPNKSPSNVSSLNICNSSQKNEMLENYEDMMRQHNQSNSPANYLNGLHPVMNGSSMPAFNQTIAPFNYFSNPMNLDCSPTYKDTEILPNVKCENDDDVSTIQEVEAIGKPTNTSFIDTNPTVNEDLNDENQIPDENERELAFKKSDYKNIGSDESMIQIKYDGNPFINDVHGVTKDDFEKKYDILKFTLVNTDSSYEVATKLVSEDKTDLQKIFECQHCNLLFQNAKRFVIHCKWHSYGKFCNIRKRQSGQTKTRKRNTKTESKEANDNKEDGKEVSDSEEDRKEVDEFSCKACNQNYPSKISLRNHMRRVHSGRSKECVICHKAFQNWSYLKSHMTTHTEEKKFMCDECPKTFKYVHSLIRHRPTHFKEKNFTCPTCDKSFGSRLLLKIHSKTHERVIKGADFRCTYCGKGFYHAYTLGIHERTHTGEKPYKCDICHSAYGTNSSLKRHLKVSHNNESKPYECTICQRAFGTDAMLDRHYLTFHPEPEGKSIRCPLCSQMFHSQTQCDAHNTKVHIKQESEPPRRKRRKKVPEVIGHICP